MPFGLRLPDWLFRYAARSMLAVDPKARSSMWEDLDRRRPTEIDYLQGAILDLAVKHATPTPITRRVRDLIREAETARKGPPGLAPEAVAGSLVRLT
jgi:2-dehydropantoate 2-reductase